MRRYKVVRYWYTVQLVTADGEDAEEEEAEALGAAYNQTLTGEDFFEDTNLTRVEVKE